MGARKQKNREGRAPPNAGCTVLEPPGLWRKPKKELAVGTTEDDGLGGSIEQQCRKRRSPLSSSCRPTAPPELKKRPRVEPAASSTVPILPVGPHVDAGAPGVPLDPVAAVVPNSVPVLAASDSGVAPLHEVVRRLQTQLGNWEGVILPEVERSLMRRKWRGMGLI